MEKNEWEGINNSMPKKFTYEFVKSKFEKEGYKLLSTEYKNSQTKLDYICINGHKHSIQFYCWKQGQRCGICSYNRKKDISFIKSKFEKERYILLSSEYQNEHTKLKFICPRGHKHHIKWNDWQQGKRCGKCSKSAKKDINFIRLEFEKEGYQLLTTEYKDQRQKLEYICPNNHRYFISGDSWERGHRCKICSRDIVSEKQKKDFDEIKKSFSNKGYQLFTTEYRNSYQKLDFVCPNEHKHSIRWGDWNTGKRCGICYREKLKADYNISLFNDYKKYVYSLTKVNFREYKSIINPLSLKRSKIHYHLDHIYSVLDGFKNNVNPEIIASVSNLRMIPAKENLSKNGNSLITKEELYNGYHQFKNLKAGCNT